MLRFSWSREKAVANIRKHGIGFLEARTVFGDPLSLAIPDSAHSIEEQRWLLLGCSSKGRLLVVAHSEDGDDIRIINARRATRQERRMYEEV
jgi:hypothetical protein